MRVSVSCPIIFEAKYFGGLSTHLSKDILSAHVDRCVSVSSPHLAKMVAYLLYFDTLYFLEY